MSSVKIALAVGLGITAVAIGVVLSGAPPVVARTNGVIETTKLASTSGGASACQAGETLPRGTSAIRLSLEAVIGPRLTVRALSGARVVTAGTRGAGWIGGSITVPVRPLPRPAANVVICVSLEPTRQMLALNGAPTAAAVAAKSRAGTLPGRMKIEYLRSGRSSWWSLAPAVVEHMGFGHAVSGVWTPLLAAVLAAMIAALTYWLAARGLQATCKRPVRPQRRLRAPPRLRKLYRRVPKVAWLCALVAFLNAACWSLVTPPFQVPDEPDHFAYAEQLAETGQLPLVVNRQYSAAERGVLAALYQEGIRFKPEVETIASLSQQRQLQHNLGEPLPRAEPVNAGLAASEPPLYYALQAIPYDLGSAGTLLDSLQLMRLLSALMAAITAFFVFLFVREALPGAPWSWTVGGLGVALFPLLGFVSGGVNPDAMLFAVSAALFYCLARGFRRGLTPGLALVIGILTAIGFLTKLNFIGLAPGVILGLVILTIRAARTSRRAACSSLALALAIACSPVLLNILIKPASSHTPLGEVSHAAQITSGSVFTEMSYIWQLYLPRLPGMSSYFPGISTTLQVWFNGLVGLYGWADTVFADWVYAVSLIPATLIVGLCVRTLVASRAALRRRLPELFVYGVMSVGVLVLVGADSYISDLLTKSEPYREPRYLLPMLALWGAVLALAARGAGRRWGPAVGALIVVLFLAHDIFSQLQVIARYYG